MTSTISKPQHVRNLIKDLAAYSAEKFGVEIPLSNGMTPKEERQFRAGVQQGIRKTAIELLKSTVK